MDLSAPTKPVFLIAVILAALAIVGQFVAIPYISLYAFWVSIVAFAILMVGNIAKGV